MWPYWFLFAVPAWLALTHLRLVANPGKRLGDWWRVVFVLLVLMIGLRHQVGGDWLAYVEHIRSASYETLLGAVIQGDPAYSLLNWLEAKSGWGPIL